MQASIIVALGDSTTAGTPGFLSPLEAPPDGQGDFESQYAFWLERGHPNWHVLNRGVNGERSDQIRWRFDRDVLQARPQVVVIIAGVNDIYQGLEPDVVKEHLLRMYDRAREAGIAVVAGTILPYNTATPDQNRKMREINVWIRLADRADRNIAMCDTRRAVADPRNSDRLASSPDGLHPSADGYRAMAEALAPVVEQTLKKKHK